MGNIENELYVQICYMFVKDEAQVLCYNERETEREREGAPFLAVCHRTNP